MNLYQYVHSGPAGITDPNGLESLRHAQGPLVWAPGTHTFGESPERASLVDLQHAPGGGLRLKKVFGPRNHLPAPDCGGILLVKFTTPPNATGVIVQKVTMTVSWSDDSGSASVSGEYYEAWRIESGVNRDSRGIWDDRFAFRGVSALAADAESRGQPCPCKGKFEVKGEAAFFLDAKVQEGQGGWSRWGIAGTLPFRMDPPLYWGFVPTVADHRLTVEWDLSTKKCEVTGEP
jgi:hypothetical protein